MSSENEIVVESVDGREPTVIQSVTGGKRLQQIARQLLSANIDGHRFILIQEEVKICERAEADIDFAKTNENKILEYKKRMLPPGQQQPIPGCKKGAESNMNRIKMVLENMNRAKIILESNLKLSDDLKKELENVAIDKEKAKNFSPYRLTRLSTIGKTEVERIRKTKFSGERQSWKQARDERRKRLEKQSQKSQKAVDDLIRKAFSQRKLFYNYLIRQIRKVWNCQQVREIKNNWESLIMQRMLSKLNKSQKKLNKRQKKTNELQNKYTKRLIRNGKIIKEIQSILTLPNYADADFVLNEKVCNIKIDNHGKLKISDTDKECLSKTIKTIDNFNRMIKSLEEEKLAESEKKD